ncbi:MAG: quinone oxidoreductase family protein [Ktedonobacterales bacterium]
MRAIQVHEVGGPEKLKLDEVPMPEPGPGQVRVKLDACGVNFIDIYVRTGQYPAPLPRTLGTEAAGMVDAVGPDVTDIHLGDRVGSTEFTGAYAEYALAPAARLVRVPEGIDTRIAAAVLLQGMTAHYLTHSTFPLKSGDAALVHAAAGGVGLLLVQIAKRQGATVIATVGREEKVQLARQAGADDVIVTASEDFEAATRRLTQGRGVDVVYDSVGRTTFDQSLNCLRPRGYLVLFGQSSGAVPPLNPQTLNAKGSLFLTRPTLAHYVATRDELDWRAGDLFTWIASGELDVRVGRTYLLEQAAAAQEALASRETTGKVLLTL